MDRIKHSRLFKCISFVLIITFLTLDIAYAYPPEHNAGNSTLAVPSLLQQQPVNDQIARFQQSLFSESAMLASVYDVGEYYFGNAAKDARSLPVDHLLDTINSDLKAQLSTTGTTILNIVPVEYLKKNESSDKLRSALDEISFKGTLPDEGVVFILYKKNDKRFLVQIAMKDHVSASSLPGYEWVISDKYLVKYVPEDYTGTSSQTVETSSASVAQEVATAEMKDSSKAVISEPIAEVSAPASKVDQSTGLMSRTFSVRAVITALTMAVVAFLPLAAFAGTGDGANIASSSGIFWIVGVAIVLISFCVNLGKRVAEALLVEKMMQTLSSHATNFGFTRFKRVDERGAGLMELGERSNQTIESGNAVICINAAVIKDNKFIDLWKRNNKLLSEISAVRLHQLHAMCDDINSNIFVWANKYGHNYYEARSRGAIYSEVNRRIYSRVGDRGAALDIWFNWIYPHPGYSSKHNDKAWVREQAKEYLRNNYLIPSSDHKSETLGLDKQESIVEEVFKVDSEFSDGFEPLQFERVSRTPSIILLAGTLLGSLFVGGCGKKVMIDSRTNYYYYECDEYSTTYLILFILLPFFIVMLNGILDEIIMPIIKNKIEIHNTEKEYVSAVELAARGDDPAIKVFTSVLLSQNENASKRALGDLLKMKADPEATGLPKIVASIAPFLNDNSVYMRRSVASILKQVGWEPKSIDEKISLNINLQEWDRLVEIGQPAVLTLLDYLQHKDVRRSVVTTLGKIRDRRAIPALIKTLKDENISIGRLAAEALQHVGWVPENDEEKILFYKTACYWDELAIMGTAAIPTLIKALIESDSGYPNERDSSKIIDSIVKIGQPAVSELISALKENVYGSKKDVVIRALSAMGLLAAHSLVEVLKDKTNSVRENAAEALFNVTSMPIIAGEDAGTDSKMETKKFESPPPDVITAVITILNNEDARVRRTAVNYLEKIGWTPATPEENALYQRIKDEEAAEKAAAEAANRYSCDSSSDDGYDYNHSTQGAWNAHYGHFGAINPFAIGFGAIALANVFSVAMDFVSTHPIITGIVVAVLCVTVMGLIKTFKKGPAAQIVDLMAKRDNLPEKADLLVVFGSGDARVAEEAAKLYHSGVVSRILVSGKYGKYDENFTEDPTNTDFGIKKDGTRVEAEALVYERILVGKNIPKEIILDNDVKEKVILVEKKSRGMTENGVNSIDELKKVGLTPKTIIFMHAPLLQLRGSLSLREALAKEGIKATVVDYAAPVAIDPDKDVDAIIWQAGRLFKDGVDAKVAPLIGQEKLDKIKSLLDTIKVEKEARAENKKGGSVTNLSINPFVIALGGMVFANVFSAVQDFTFAHPIITAIIAWNIIGILWRALFPESWYMLCLKRAFPSLRSSAAKGLGEIKCSRAVEPLIETLEDSDSTVRSNAAWALGEIGDARAKEPLTKLLSDINKDVSRIAATSLKKISVAQIVDIFSKVKSQVPAGATELSAALNELEQYGVVTDHDKRAAKDIKDIEAKYNLSEGEKRIFWSAIIGPAAGMSPHFTGAGLRAAWDEKMKFYKELGIKRSVSDLEVILTTRNEQRNGIESFHSTDIDMSVNPENPWQKENGGRGNVKSDIQGLTFTTIYTAWEPNRYHVIYENAKLGNETWRVSMNFDPVFKHQMLVTPMEARTQVAGENDLVAMQELLSNMGDVNATLLHNSLMGGAGINSLHFHLFFYDFPIFKNGFTKYVGAVEFDGYNCAQRAGRYLKHLQDVNQPYNIIMRLGKIIIIPRPRDLTLMCGSDAMAGVVFWGNDRTRLQANALADRINPQPKGGQGGFITTPSINPFAIALGVTLFVNLFSVIWNFVAVHPVIIVMAGVVIGGAVFFMILRIKDPLNYYLWKLTTPIFGNVRREGVMGLRMFESKVKIQPLLKILKEERFNIRRSAGEALLEINDPRLSPLNKYLSDPVVPLTAHQINLILECIRDGEGFSVALSKDNALEKSVYIPGFSLPGSWNYVEIKRISAQLSEPKETPQAEEQNRKPDVSASSTPIHSAVPRTSQLFDMVEASLNSNRAKYIKAGNELVGCLKTTPTLDSGIDATALTGDMTSAEIRQKVARAITIASRSRNGSVSKDIREKINYLKSNINQFEADGAVGALIVLARKAQRDGQKLIIGLEMDWIPGMNVKGSLQRSAISALMKEIDSIGDTLRSMGLDNVEIVRGSGSDLSTAIIDRADKTHTNMRNVVVMASSRTINSESFSALRNAKDGEKPFLAGIDPSELIRFYASFDENTSNQLHIRLAGLLYMTLELAAGKEPPQTPVITSYDKKNRIIFFLPKVEPIEYEALKNAYNAEVKALTAA